MGAAWELVEDGWEFAFKERNCLDTKLVAENWKSCLAW